MEEIHPLGIYAEPLSSYRFKSVGKRGLPYNSHSLTTEVYTTVPDLVQRKEGVVFFIWNCKQTVCGRGVGASHVTHSHPVDSHKIPLVLSTPTIVPETGGHFELNCCILPGNPDVTEHCK